MRIPKSANLSVSSWEVFVRKLSSVFLKHKFVRALLLPTGFSLETAGIRTTSLPAYSELLKDNKLSIYSEPPAVFQGDVGSSFQYS
jgi:hypothetical protein